MSNIGSFFNLGSQTTLVNQTNGRLRLKINPSQSTDVNFVFPANEGDASGYVLATDGSGTTSWVAQSGGGSTNPGGNANAIQFNGGASDFSGVNNLTFNSTTNVLGVTGDVSTNTLNVGDESNLRGDLNVTGNSNLSAVDISSTLDVSGITTLNNTLNVNALTFLNNNVDVSGDISCNSRIVLSTFERTISFEDGEIIRFFNNGINIGDPSCGLIDQSYNNIAIGFGAGYENQTLFNIAIGQEAGKTNQGNDADGGCIAIGYQAGNNTQGSYGVAIGKGAGYTTQSSDAIAIGRFAGETDQNENAIAIGKTAGGTTQGINAVAIGEDAGQITQGSSSVAIGFGAGQITQGSNSIAIGEFAGSKNLGEYSIAIGYRAEFDNSTNNVTQNVIVLNATEDLLNSDVSSAFFVKPLRDVSDNVAPATNRNEFKVMVYDPIRGEIAYDASYNGTATGSPGGDANAIQFNGGASDFSGVSNLTFDSSLSVLGVNGDISLNGNILMPAGIRIGNTFTGNLQSFDAIAIGNTAGNFSQSSNAIAIGIRAGNQSQSNSAIAIGRDAGYTIQGNNAVAIGENAGRITQGSYGVAIGLGAGNLNQSSNSIAIGRTAGSKNLGEYSIAIGYQAEFDNSTNNVTQNVIVLNATEDLLNSDVSSALFIKPLRDVSSVSTPAGRTRDQYKIMVYDSSSGEIAYDASYNGTATGGSTNPGGDANAIQFKGGASDFSGVNNLTFNSTTNVLSVTGDISTNTLNVSDESNLGGDLNVTGTSNLSAVDISSTLDVSGITTLNNTLNVNANSNLSAVNISSTLDVGGTTTLDDALTVNDLTFLNNNLNVTGDISLNGNITFNGNASDTTITSDASLSIIAENGNIVIEASGGNVDISANQINLVNQIIDNSGGSINTGSITANNGASITSSLALSHDFNNPTSGATLTLDNSSSLIMTPRVFNDINDFSGQDLQPASSILIFDYSNNQDVDCSLNYNSGVTQGQHLSIFYLNRNATPGHLRIDFGANNIVTGSGANRYLTFTSFGQSAELLAYGNNNNYLVFNAGTSAS